MTAGDCFDPQGSVARLAATQVSNQLRGTSCSCFSCAMPASQRDLAAATLTNRYAVFTSVPRAASDSSFAATRARTARGGRPCRHG